MSDLILPTARLDAEAKSPQNLIIFAILGL